MNTSLINKRSHYQSPITHVCVVLAAMAGLTFLTACFDSDQAGIRTPETEKAKAEVETYNATGSKEDKLEVERAFSDLDGEIRELEVRVNSTNGGDRVEAQNKLEELRKRKTELRMEFTKAKFNALLEDIKSAVR